MKLGQGYIFTGICDSVHRGVPAPGGGGLPAPGPHTRGNFRGIRSRPTPNGDIEGD